MTELPQERSEDNLKQLLIAQDNILKESERIGSSEGIHTTFVYQKPVEQQITESGSSHVAIVPRESRRGGRAYNIHQHVNEV